MDTTNKLYIYGAGGHGRVLADIARECGYTEILFIDDTKQNYVPFDEVAHKAPIVIAIGDNGTRERRHAFVKKQGWQIVSLIHPSSIISSDVRIGEGTVIMPRVVVNTGSTIGKGSILNTGCIVEHDCCINDFVHISPNAALAGGVKVGKRTHVGIGANIIQNRIIADDSIVGAGAVVLEDVPTPSVVVGIPAKKIKEN